MQRMARLSAVSFGSVVLVGGLFVGVTPAGASTTIGQTGVDSSIGCFGGATSQVQVSTGSGVPSYVVPSGINELTSWSAQGDFRNTILALEVWRPTTTPGTYVLVGASPVDTVLANTLTTFTLTPPISVQPGDVLGQLSTGASDFCFVTGSGAEGDVVGSAPTDPTTLPVPGTTVQVTDRPFVELNVAATGTFVSEPTPIITTRSLPSGTLNRPYYFQLEATGGTLPYTWNKYGPVGSGRLPLGLSLSKSGLISGTPQRTGTFTITVKCLDSTHSHKTQATQELTLIINP